MKKLLLIFAFVGYTSLWSGTNKLDLWHESTLSITKTLGVGTEFGYDLFNRPRHASYGYLFMYVQPTNNIRFAVGKDYQGEIVTQVKIVTQIGK